MGIIIHEFSHQLFCQLSGVRVYKVKYFQMKNPPGYVEHAQPRNFIQAFFISMGPFFFGTIISLLLFLFTAHEIVSILAEPKILNIQYLILSIFSFWFGLAIAIHCFPSTGDAKVLLSETNYHVFKRFNPLAALLYPFVFIIKTANYLRKYYFDWAYAVFLLIIAFWLVRT